MAQIIAARLRTLGLFAALALVLAGCSAVQLGYGQAHSLLYWWIDGYADLDDAQSSRLRQDIDRFMAWHRQSELPTYAQRLQRWQLLAMGDLNADQVCAEVDAVQQAGLRLIERARDPLARLALAMSAEQLQHLEAHQAETNQRFEKDFLRGNAQQRLDRRLERAVDRYESLYGSLTTAQVERVRQALRASPFDAARALADRKARQAELRDLIRRWQAAGNTADAIGPAVQAWLQRSLFAAPTAPTEAAAWLRHGCQTFAELHNTTSPEQRRHAQAEWQRYGADLRALANGAP